MNTKPTAKVHAFRIRCNKYYYTKRPRKLCPNPNCKYPVTADEFVKVKVDPSRLIQKKATKPGVKTFTTKKKALKK